MKPILISIIKLKVPGENVPDQLHWRRKAGLTPEGKSSRGLG